jgi:hypothetical protein
MARFYCNKTELWKNEQMKFNYLKTNEQVNSKEKNDRKIFLLDWLKPNLCLKDLKDVACTSLIIGGDHDVILLYRPHLPKLTQRLFMDTA